MADHPAQRPQTVTEVCRNTGAKTKRDAILTAVAQFNRRRRLAKIAARLGSFNGFITNEELKQQCEEG